MPTSVLTYVLSICSALLVAIISAALTRRKTKSEVQKNLAESENIVAQSLKTALTELRQERDDDRLQIQQNKEQIKELKAENKELAAAHEECEFEHGITRMQLKKALHKLELFSWKKATVFVLDDQDIVIKVFAKWWERLPVIDFKAFTDPQQFLKEAQRERPEILILDYVLGESQTAEDIIKQLGYEPRIFIMSATKEYEVKFKGTEVLFFYKDRFYIRNISKSILEYLEEKNRNT